MRYRHFLTGLLLLLLVIVAAYNACSMPNQFNTTKSYGTIAPNPATPTAAASSEILFALCSVLDRCQAQVPMNTCMSGVLTTNGIGARLGLPPNTDDPFSTLENAESSGAIVANLNAANTCVDAINNLSCSDPNVQNAYNATAANPFAAVPFMVPVQSCGLVYAPPVQQYACSTKVFLRGTNSSNAPAFSGSGYTYTIAPPLPAGLSLNASTGAISGAPTVVTAMTAYTVTATNSQGGANQAVLNIRTADGYTVNDLGDAADAVPGNHLCSTASGTCTLRAAIQEIDSSAVSNVVLVPPGTISVSSSLAVTGPLDIYGNCDSSSPTVIDGGGATQIFSITNGPTSLNNLTVQNGYMGNSFGKGAGIGIDNPTSTEFSATLQNVVVQGNVVNGSSSFGDGAGVFVQGSVSPVTLTLNNCLFANNINNSTGVGFSGGGIEFYFGSSGVINNSTFSGNKVTGTSGNDGAGIEDKGASSLSISNSLLSNNICTGSGSEGGALHIDSMAGSVSITNVTFAGNSCDLVGGVYQSNSSVLKITNSSFINNKSNQNNYGGALGGVSGTTQYLNTLFQSNLSSGTLGHCGGAGGAMTSLGFNLSDDVATDCGFGVKDIVKTLALLGPLQGNGGLTLTQALLPGSPGINQGTNSGCPATDQRGYGRPAQGICDIGAFEAQ